MTDRSASRRILAHAQPGTNVEEIETMHMALNVRRWTRADLGRLPDDGNRYEVVRGELFVTPPPSVRHETLVGRLMRQIIPYVWSHGFGEVQIGHGVLVFEGSQAEPDLVVRPLIGDVKTWDQMPTPYLVIEVQSPTTARRDRLAKRPLYLEAGVAAYWMVDGERRVITVARRGETEVVCSSTLRWQPIGGLDPLELDVSAIFG